MSFLCVLLSLVEARVTLLLVVLWAVKNGLCLRGLRWYKFSV